MQCAQWFQAGWFLQNAGWFLMANQKLKFTCCWMLPMWTLKAFLTSAINWICWSVEGWEWWEGLIFAH